MKKSLAGVGLATCVALVVASCAGGVDGSADEGVVTLGLIIPTSGALAELGENAIAGMEVALDHIEEEGGVLDGEVELRMEVKDEQGGPEEAIQAARDFLAEDVQLITGMGLSDDCLAVAPFIERTEAVLVTSLCAVGDVTGGVAGEAPFERTFGMASRDSMVSRATAKVISERYPDVSDYSLFALDYAWGHGTVESFADAMRDNGVDVNWTQEYWVPSGSSSFRSQISAMDRGLSEEGSEALFLGTFSASTTNFMLQADAFGIFDNVEFVVNNGGYYGSARSLDGRAEQVWNGYDYHYAAFDNELNERFVEDFEEKTGKKPISYSLQQYNATRAIAAAIEVAGSADASEVRSALEGLQFDSPVGEVTIGAKSHQAMVPVAVTLTEGDPEAPEGVKLIESVIVEPEMDA